MWTSVRGRFCRMYDLSQPPPLAAQLRKLAWNGVPHELRPLVWPLLLGYLPLPKPTRTSTLARKRREYASLVETTFSRGRDGLDQQIWHQIEIDVPRTRPGVRLWMQASTQRVCKPDHCSIVVLMKLQSLERILYVWAIRHPASGYVQGINDLATPFFQVFLGAYIGVSHFYTGVVRVTHHTVHAESDPEDFDTAMLPDNVRMAVEADTFWCLSRLLDGIQDNYIAGQPGIHRSVKRMAELVARIDGTSTPSIRLPGLSSPSWSVQHRWQRIWTQRTSSSCNSRFGG